jgi:hypothetical protein
MMCERCQQNSIQRVLTIADVTDETQTKTARRCRVLSRSLPSGEVYHPCSPSTPPSSSPHRWCSR